MKREDFWYNPEAESVSAIPTGAKAGQFLFLSAQTGIDLDTGEIIRDLIDLPPKIRDKFRNFAMTEALFGPVMAQTWTIYENLSKILAKQGASLKDIIRQRIYLCNIRDIGWMEEVMLSFFPEEKPATLILGVPSRGLHEDIRVWVDAIALIPQKGGLKKEAIYLPEHEKVNGPYPQGVKVGQFLFFEGLRGIDPKTGRPVTTFEELGPEAASFRRTDGLYSSSASEALICQWWSSVNNNLRYLLQSQGAGLMDLLQLNGFLRNDMRDCPEREYVRKKLFKTAKNAPSSPTFCLHNLSPISDVEWIVGGVALLPGEYHKESGKYGITETDATLSTLTKAGPFFFFCPMCIDRKKRKHITSLADLIDNGRFHAHSRIDASQTDMAKASYAYTHGLQRVQAKPSQILHQTVYLLNPSRWPAYENMIRIVSKGHIPPTTIVPVDDGQYYFKYHMRTPQSIRGERLPSSWWEEGERPEIQCFGLTETE